MVLYLCFCLMFLLAMFANTWLGIYLPLFIYVQLTHVKGLTVDVLFVLALQVVASFSVTKVVYFAITYSIFSLAVIHHLYLPIN